VGFSIRILEGPEKNRLFTFDRIEVTIGRTVDNDVVLPDPSISRQHMSIRDKGGAYIVKDLGSSNGTKVNGKAITEEVLKAGDVIAAGNVRIRFEGGSGAARSEKAVRGKGGPAPSARASGGGAAPGKARSDPRAPAPAPAAQPGRPIIRAQRMRTRKAEPEKAAQPDPGAAEPTVAPGTQRGSSARKKGKGAPRVTAITRLVEKFRALPKRSRMLIMAGAGLVVLFLLVAAVRGGKQVIRQMTDHSNEEFAPGELNSSNNYMTFGNGPGVDTLCMTKVVFRFKYGNGRSTLVYQAGMIDNLQEVTLQLNGMEIGHLPVTLDKWTDPIFVTLPRKHLLENDINRVTFVNTVNFGNPKAKETWGVAVLAIQEEPLPQADPAKAKEAFELAQTMDKNRDVALPNAYRAMENYRRARDFLELLPENQRSDTYQESTDRAEQLDAELNRRFADLMFTAEKELNYNRYAKARNIYRDLMMIFPNPEDPRHLRAKGKLEEIGE